MGKIKDVRGKICTFISFFDFLSFFPESLSFGFKGELGQVYYRHLCIDYLLSPYFFLLILNLNKCKCILNMICFLPPKEFWMVNKL